MFAMITKSTEKLLQKNINKYPSRNSTDYYYFYCNRCMKIILKKYVCIILTNIFVTLLFIFIIIYFFDIYILSEITYDMIIMSNDLIQTIFTQNIIKLCYFLKNISSHLNPKQSMDLIKDRYNAMKGMRNRCIQRHFLPTWC